MSFGCVIERRNHTSSPGLPPALRGPNYFEEDFVAERNRIRENPSGSIAAVLDTSVQDLLVTERNKRTSKHLR